MKILPLISSANIHSIDCMGTVVETQAVCMAKDKEMFQEGVEENLYLLRSYVRNEKKDIVCEFGEGVQLSLVCEGLYRDFCKTPKKSCMDLKKIYSAEVPLWKYSISDEEQFKKIKKVNKGRNSLKMVNELHCYFANNDQIEPIK